MVPSILSVLCICLYIAVSVLVCRRASRDAKCGRIKTALTLLLAAFFILSLFSPLRFKLTGRQIPERLFPDGALPYLVVLGLLGGCAGDTILEISETGKSLILGLSSFLLGHIFYSAASLTQIRAEYFRPEYLLLLFFYAVPVGFVVMKVLPSVDASMKPGVTAYMTVIILMSATNMMRLGSVPAVSWICGLTGSLLFILSDIILAMHIFNGKTFNGVMETYTVAQALLTFGYLLAA